MRRLFVGLMIGALGFISVEANAGALTAAELSFAIGTLPPAVFPASGATGTATSNLSAGVAAGNAFNGTTTTTVPTTAAPPITQIQVIISKNEAGNFTGGTPDAVGGNMLLAGISNVKGFGGLTLLGVPVELGVPGTTDVAAAGVNITVINASWTVGAATITGLGGMTPTAMLTGSNMLNATGSGVITLVTPVKIITNLAGTLAAFGVLELTYAPEPGMMLLLGVGAATMAIAGARRRRS
jgi:hypothetical protein